MGRFAAGAGLDDLLGPRSPLRKGERICFVGDSITVQGGYVERIRAAFNGDATAAALGVEVLQHWLNGGRTDTIASGQTPWGKQLPSAAILAQDKPPHASRQPFTTR